jgi:hypothetical protein
MKEQGAKNPYRVSDALWAKIEPLLPKHPNTHRFGGGRPRVPDRQAMGGANRHDMKWVEAKRLKPSRIKPASRRDGGWSSGRTDA